MSQRVFFNQRDKAPVHLKWEIYNKWDEIARLSPLFEIHALRLASYPNYVWQIPFNFPPSRDLITDAVGLFEEVVGSSRVRDGTNDTVSRWEQDVRYGQVTQPLIQLSEYSSILWYLHIIPERLNLPWAILEDVVKTEALPHGPPKTSGEDGDTGNAKDTIKEYYGSPPRAPSVQGDTRSIVTQLSGCCWNQKADAIPSEAASLRRANIALILDQGTFKLKNAMAHLIWAYAPGHSHDSSLLLAECFRWDGDEGLEQRRQDEFRHISEWFDKELKRSKPSRFKKLHAIFTQHQKSERKRRKPPSESISIYAWIKRLEDLVLQELFRTNPGSATIRFNIPLATDYNRTYGVGDSTEISPRREKAQEELQKDNWKLIEKMNAEDGTVLQVFRDADSEIERRQEIVTQNFKTWRDKTVEGWKKEVSLSGMEP